MSIDASTRRRFFVPEVVQTSTMDCGPATLKCLLEGFGIPISYGRLREACQTDVDGTSIDTMEEIARQLGLEAEQVMMPVDHLFLPEAGALPAILVVRQLNGLTHFVVAWRCHGRFVQLMDPATGRRWTTCRRFMDEVYAHQFALSAGYWREWAGSEEFLGALRRRLVLLGLATKAIARLADVALADASWRTLAALDAATRMVEAVVRSGGLRQGRSAERVLDSFFDQSRAHAAGQRQIIPSHYWTVQPTALTASGEEQVLMRGAVLVRVLGRHTDDAAAEIFVDDRKPDDRALPLPATEERGEGRGEGQSDETNRPLLPPREERENGATATPRKAQRSQLSPELVAALAEKQSRPGHELLRLLRADGLLAPATLIAALALAAAGVIFEAVLFRGL